jgi:uridine kinase
LNNKPEGGNTIIAIAGASASGKSLFASTVYHELVAELGSERIAIVSEDAYYRDQSHLPFSQRVLTNYDHPSAFEHSLLASHLQTLRQGGAIEMPQYRYLSSCASQMLLGQTIPTDYLTILLIKRLG